MTIDEAIRILKLSIRNSREHIRFCYDEKGITALDMAIQALEQESSVSENPNNCEMRDATLEERESIDKYIKSISKPTGVKFGALDQEPCEDVISRGEVLENAFKIYTHECGLLEVVGVATIKTLPSVKPQERIGHWIIYKDCEGKTRECTCDQCGYKTGKYTWHNPNFCSNCGAKMIKPQETKQPEISSYYGLKSYVRERSDKE